MKVQTYFILAQQTNRVKIGKSVAPSKRLRGLSTASGEPLLLLGVLDGDYERELKDRFSSARLYREWFDYCIIRPELKTLLGVRLPGTTQLQPMTTKIVGPDREAVLEVRYGLPLLRMEFDEFYERVYDGVGAAGPHDDHLWERLVRRYPGLYLCAECQERFEQTDSLASCFRVWWDRVHGVFLETPTFVGVVFDVPPGARKQPTHRFWTDINDAEWLADDLDVELGLEFFSDDAWMTEIEPI